MFQGQGKNNEVFVPNAKLERARYRGNFHYEMLDNLTGIQTHVEHLKSADELTGTHEVKTDADDLGGDEVLTPYLTRGMRIDHKVEWKVVTQFHYQIVRNRTRRACAKAKQAFLTAHLN